MSARAVPLSSKSASLRRVVDRRAFSHLSHLGVAAACAIAALLGAVGADSRWAAALGRAIAHGAPIHGAVPFAQAPTKGWVNVPVLGELGFAAFASVGDRGLFIAQVAAVAVAFAALAAAMSVSGAGESAAVAGLLVAAVGSTPALAAARLQLFSLALFGILLWLLHREVGAPSRRVWLLPPLLALWSNLHGAVLVGLAVAALYLLVERFRHDRLVSCAVLVASGVAIFATPALLDTPRYYLGVTRSEAARQGVGLWVGLSPTVPLDLVLVVCAIVLGGLALRGRPRSWELLVVLALALLTFRTSRSGVWLLMFTSVPAARGIRLRGALRPRVAGLTLLALVVSVLFGIVRGPLPAGARDGLVRKAIARAAGTPILAQDALAEQVALAGGTIWVGNPLDAFTRADQRLYLAWNQGRSSGDAALGSRLRVVLVHPGSAAQRRLAASRRFREVARDVHAVLYVAAARRG